NRTRHDFPPSVSVEHPIDGGVMDLTVQQIFEGFLDLAGHANPARGGKLKEHLRRMPLSQLSTVFGPNLLYRDITLCTVETETSVWIAISEAGRGSTKAFQITNHLRCSLPAVCLSRIDTSNSERCGSADVTPPITCLP